MAARPVGSPLDFAIELHEVPYSNSTAADSCAVPDRLHVRPGHGLGLSIRTCCVVYRRPAVLSTDGRRTAINFATFGGTLPCRHLLRVSVHCDGRVCLWTVGRFDLASCVAEPVPREIGQLVTQLSLCDPVLYSPTADNGRRSRVAGTG